VLSLGRPPNQESESTLGLQLVENVHLFYGRKVSGRRDSARTTLGPDIVNLSS